MLHLLTASSTRQATCLSTLEIVQTVFIEGTVPAVVPLTTGINFDILRRVSELLARQTNASAAMLSSVVQSVSIKRIVGKGLVARIAFVRSDLRSQAILAS